MAVDDELPPTWGPLARIMKLFERAVVIFLMGC